MRIVTWNVAALAPTARNAELAHGSLAAFFASELGADVVCLQECKLAADKITRELALVDGYEVRGAGRGREQAWGPTCFAVGLEGRVRRWPRRCGATGVRVRVTRYQPHPAPARPRARSRSGRRPSAARATAA